MKTIITENTITNIKDILTLEIADNKVTLDSLAMVTEIVGNRRKMWSAYDSAEDPLIKMELLKSKLMHISCEVAEAYKELGRDDFKDRNAFIEEMADIILTTIGISSHIGIDKEVFKKLGEKSIRNLDRKD